jgi:hypothetical protein
MFIGAICLSGCESKESQKAAILKALEYDRSVGAKVNDSQSFFEGLFGASEETTASYVRNLKRVPLDGCPADFQEAYQRHIAAWESRNRNQIKATWLDVISVARLHDVNFSVSP